MKRLVLLVLCLALAGCGQIAVMGTKHLLDYVRQNILVANRDLVGKNIVIHGNVREIKIQEREEVVPGKSYTSTYGAPLGNSYLGFSNTVIVPPQLIKRKVPYAVMVPTTPSGAILCYFQNFNEAPNVKTDRPVYLVGRMVDIEISDAGNTFVYLEKCHDISECVDQNGDHIRGGYTSDYRACSSLIYQR